MCTHKQVMIRATILPTNLGYTLTKLYTISLAYQHYKQACALESTVMPFFRSCDHTTFVLQYSSVCEAHGYNNIQTGKVFKHGY